MKKRSLVVLCDYGLDDAAATCDLLHHAEAFSAIDILAVGGNLPPDVALRNLRTLLATVPHPGNVRAVDTTKVPQPSKYLAEIHGNDGMGDLFAPATDGTPVIGFDEWFAVFSGCDVLLSLSPMTLTRRLLEKAPVGEFIFMAGNVSSTPNFNGYEFNEGMDLAAFDACVRYPHAAVTLDAACPALNTEARDIPGDTPYPRMIRRFRELLAAVGERGCHVWDDVAVQYLLHPERFRVLPRRDKRGNLLSTLEYRGQDYPPELF